MRCCKGDVLARIPKGVILLGVVSLLTDMSSQMVFPLLPLFLSVELHAKMWMIGLVRGTAEFTGSVFKPVSGRISDKLGKRKGLVLLGYAIAAVLKPLFGFANHWYHVLVLRVSERVGKGVRVAPRDAMVAELAKSGHVGAAYGIQRSLDAAGKVGGAVFLFVLFYHFAYSFRKIFLVAALPAVAGVFILLLVREGTTKGRAATQRPGSGSAAKEQRLLPKPLLFFIAAVSVFSFGNYTQDFIILRAINVGLGVESVLFSNILFFMAIIVMAYLAGELADIIGRLPLVFLALVIFVITTVMLIYVDSYVEYLIAFTMFGVFYGLWDTIPRTLVSDMATRARATGFGAYHMAVGLSSLPGVAVAGMLWDLLGPVATFVFSLCLAGTALVMMGVFRSAYSRWTAEALKTA